MIDSHAHLTDERFADEVEAVVARAREAGLEATITVGTGLEDSAAALSIARRYPDVFATVGIHPHAASTATEEALARVRDLAADPRVVAIGETGLDYHYDFSPREAQRSAFERQLRLAAELSLPIVVHAREADADLQAMIREHGRDVRGVLHSFSSGAELLHAALELGWYASFAGMITFKNYGDAELVRAVPADRLMVETDSPYLTPVPHRGKRNEPCRVVLVAAKAAELRGEDAAELDARTTANARRFYALDARRGSLMPRRIRILPDHLINQIAAGEVVERPASVVKELMENALDAGAARVEVGIKNGGKTEIRVADDGHGMGREDVLLALDRHATSKLREPSDLAAIRTLGFRGEALPSIASVSRMVLESSEREGDGTRIVVHGGRVDVVEGCARRVGTSVTVRSLFFNVPVRAKFLRSAASEARAVSEVATTLALAHPEVAFRLESNGRDLIDVAAAPEVRSRIGALWGEALAGELIPVRHSASGGTLSGWIERPHSATAAGRRAYLFVNGRSFSDRFLVRAADRGYQTTLPPGVRPSLFLFLDVPEGEVDVNVHPTKAEVRFRDGIGIERLVEEGVRLALAPVESAASLGARSAPLVAAGYAAAPPERPAELFSPVGEGSTDQMSLFVTGARAQPAGGAEERDGARVQPAMWQVHNTYIFAETRSGLIVVDQHSAHERVLYEELMRSYDETPPDSQRLLFPITLRLSPAECAVIEQLSGLFARMGFEIEPFGGRSVIVQAVPVPHPYFDADRCLREMIAELTEGSPLVDSARNQHQRVALSFACKAAIKAGQRLSQREMTELFDKLFATELPYHDIHGRPTIVELSLAELHNRFRRSG